MVLALDVHYRTNQAYAVGILFNWNDAQPLLIVKARIEEINEYVPGEFYKRELPCLLEIVNKTDLKSLEAIIIDGHVYIDGELNFGLGGKLWETLDTGIPVIGVAKTAFYKNKNTVREVCRGESKNPLYISAIGMDVSEAANRIKDMEGDFRIPSLLKQLDVLTKTVSI